MKIILKYVAWLSLLLNVYYELSWIIAFNGHNTHEKRVEAFHSMTLSCPVLIFIVLTLLSLCYFIIYLKESKVLYGISAALQVVFLFLFLFSLL